MKTNITLRRLNNIFKYSVPLPAAKNVSLTIIKDVSKTTFELYPTIIILSISMVFLPGLFLDFKRIPLVLSFFAYGFAIILILILFFRFPERIARPILLMVVLWELYVGLCGKYTLEITGVRRKIFYAFAVLLCIALGIFAFYRIKQANDIHRNRQKHYHDRVAALENANAKYFLIEPTIGLQKNAKDPLRVYHHKYEAIPLGWHIFSPFFYKKLYELDMEYAHQIFPNLVNNKKTFIIGQKKFIKSIIGYLKQTYNLDCKTVIVVILATLPLFFKL